MSGLGVKKDFLYIFSSILKVENVDKTRYKMEELVCGDEPRALYMLSKYTTSKLHFQPSFFRCILRQPLEIILKKRKFH